MIRPQSSKEQTEGCRICTWVYAGEPQVLLGKDKAFTYDFVFDMDTDQIQVYETCVRGLVEGCFQGYNATVLAYGQTGAGKTHTMGSGFDLVVTEEELGIIPRAVRQLFSTIQEHKASAYERGLPEPSFKVSAQFLELYNEEILDLFDVSRDPDSRYRKSNIRIHEDASGGIYVSGASIRSVSSEGELLQLLKEGALSRTTASTQMNSQSSRSHAIFSVHLQQTRVSETCSKDSSSLEYETLTAKFHFVDLAGSERLKRTGATGERAREGISINCGLLALGNVISALGDQSKKVLHVPYRDSKLTRLLQDSLGGNSQTMMIACVSPSDRDFMETLNTLKYANRARNIKNRVTANQEQSGQQVQALRAELARVKLELQEYKTGHRVAGNDSLSDMCQELSMLRSENASLRLRVTALQEAIRAINARVTRMAGQEAAHLVQRAGDSNEEIQTLIQNYIHEIEELRTRLVESEAMNESLRRSLSRSTARSLVTGPATPTPSLEKEANEVVRRAKEEVQNLKKKGSSLQSDNYKKSLKQQLQISEETDYNEGEEEDDHEESECDEEESEGSGESEAESDSEPEEKGLGCWDAGKKSSGPLSLWAPLTQAGSLQAPPPSQPSPSLPFCMEEGSLGGDLADLTCEIEIKQRLIEELEQSQRRLQTLKLQYEEKLQQLQSRIRDTQLERDRVLRELSSMECYTEEKANKIRADYEKKLREMNRDLQKLQLAQREHTRLLKNQSRYERELKKLQMELSDMKKAKSALMKQMREEQQLRKLAESRRNKEIAQLKKEHHRQELHIRALESQKRQQEIVLRRKTQEVSALRRLSRRQTDRSGGRSHSVADSGAELSTSTASSEPDSSLRSVSSIVRHWNRKTSGDVGPVPNGSRTPRRKGVRPGLPLSKAAHMKWQTLERRVHEVVLQRLTLLNLESDMERLLRKREELSLLQEALISRSIALPEDRKAEEKSQQDVAEELEALTANIDYVNDCIRECQATIVQMEETKEDLDSTDTSVVISSCSLTEARHLLDNFLRASIDKGLQVAQKEAQIRILEARIRQTDMAGLSQAHMLLEKSECHSVQQAENGYASTDEEVSEISQTSDGSASFSSMKGSCSQDDFKWKGEPRLSWQVKAVSAESLSPLLEASTRNITKSLASLTDILEDVGGFSPSGLRGRASHSLTLPIRGNTFPRQSRGFNTSPVTRRKSYDRGQPRASDSNLTPPSSPPMRPRNDKNVFSRLTSSQSSGTALDKSDESDSSFSDVSRGIISQFGGLKSMRTAPLQCVAIAEGHTKPVLCVEATDELLFTGSKDRTCKLWNLVTGQEIASLRNHPHNVVSLKHCPNSGLVLTASASCVRVWDIRDSARCVRTLLSSGQVMSGDICSGLGFRSGSSTQAELQINQITLNPDGTILYAAAGNAVRAWDLSRFQPIGKLTGHMAPVMCLTVSNTQNGRDLVITGSKDHYVKIFELHSGWGGAVPPTYNLEPPHYDGIECLAVQNGILCSGSRDNGIKKWDLQQHELTQQVPNAHRDWICALGFVPGRSMLLSGCRGGILKVWNMENFTPIGEIKGHESPINAMCSNSRHIFTASSDCRVKLWVYVPGLTPCLPRRVLAIKGRATSLP
ncbi:kinesin-like protein KIF21B isoform X5 [Xenopus tropicalis]|uniref:Kinesin-like protein KIF21B isoform X5 n=1 Tax=Xenopus tropicalis TaxID=8364 RepID=A0A8J0SW07_XENTR|nr:kinesin-like protein KIF21B isoform X5 [Xenopus tropicalis]|eukprot:XP_012826383.1 PREDICTED: kinesin-like protein KIF21B isoform X5 [Xenopus tropicalis]